MAYDHDSCEAAGGQMSAKLLTQLNVAGRIEKMCDHPYHFLAERQVKAIKFYMLHAKSHKELEELGRDVEARLKKDKHNLLLQEVVDKQLSYEKVIEEIRLWMSEHDELVKSLLELDEISPELRILEIEVVKKLSETAKAEGTGEVAIDCAQARAAELGNALENMAMYLKKVTHGLYRDGPHCWTTGMEDSKIEEVLQRAASTIAKVEGTDLCSAKDKGDKAVVAVWQW